MHIKTTNNSKNKLIKIKRENNNKYFFLNLDFLSILNVTFIVHHIYVTKVY